MFFRAELGLPKRDISIAKMRVCWRQVLSIQNGANFIFGCNSLQKSWFRFRRKYQQCSSPLKLQCNLYCNSLRFVDFGDVRHVWIMFVPPSVLLVIPRKFQHLAFVGSASNALLLSSCSAICIAIPCILYILVMSDVFDLCSFHLQFGLQF